MAPVKPLLRTGTSLPPVPALRAGTALPTFGRKIAARLAPPPWPTQRSLWTVTDGFAMEAAVKKSGREALGSGSKPFCSVHGGVGQHHQVIHPSFLNSFTTCDVPRILVSYNEC